MSPAEAGAVEFEEPDWRERFEDYCARWPRLERYQQEDEAFEATLKDWRRFHWTPVEVNGETKRQPAGAIEGMIALAKLGVMAPRSTLKDVPRTGAIGYQHDEHVWLQVAGEQWRVTAIEDHILFLEGMDGDKKQIDLTRAKWNKHIDAAVAILEAHDTEGAPRMPQREAP
jgi:hypothetical protein